MINVTTADAESCTRLAETLRIFLQFNDIRIVAETELIGSPEFEFIKLISCTWFWFFRFRYKFVIIDYICYCFIVSILYVFNSYSDAPILFFTGRTSVSVVFDLVYSYT